MLCLLWTQGFLPEVKLAIDVAKLVRTADHPLVRQQQGQAQGGRLDLMLHVLSWRRMVSQFMSS